MIRQLFKDFNVLYKETGNRHCRRGWVQVNCPMCLCGDEDFHMGYNLNYGRGFSCYRCGNHNAVKVLAKMLAIQPAQARMTLKRYRCIASTVKGQEGALQTPDSGIIKEYKAPQTNMITPLTKAPWDYLKSRFPWYSDLWIQDMIGHYKMSYTDWKCADTPSCIVIPTYQKGKPVCYQCRDYTGTSKTKYLNSKSENEVVSMKEVVWGLDDVVSDTVMVCEGVFDAITIGPGAVHLGGIGLTKTQIEILKGFRKIYIVFDNEPKAQDAAKRLANSLNIGREVLIVTIDGHDINTCSLEEIAQLKGLVQ